MFRTVSLSIIRSLALYTQQHIQVMLYDIQLCFSLENEHHPKPAAPNLQTHNELRKRGPTW